MMKYKFTWFIYISFLLLQLPLRLTAQVLVDRCKMLDQTSPIHNIWVDDDNIKWVANSQGLNKVFSLDIVEKVAIPAGITSLLTIRGGNAKLEWSTSEMQNLIGDVNLTCASHDPKSKTIWLGTQESGAFQISLSTLRIVQRLNIDNHKLTSDQINDIFITANGTTYIATNDGMLIGSGDKWTLQERYLNFVGVDAWGQNLWILGDDFLWQVDNKGKWSPIAIELKNVEGQLRDIAVDQKGRVWIASNMMTGYDVNADKYQRFSPGQYFTSQFVNCLDVDKDGSIWTGTADKGLYLIQWESSMIISIEMVSPLDCKSRQPSASLSVRVAGGQPPYTYQWNTGQTTPDLSQLTLGEYILTVTDAKGITKTRKYQITDPSVKVSVVQVSPSSGSTQGDGSANLLASGGTGQYIIQWDNGEATMTASKLTTGIHAVTVTDKSGCSAIANVTITENVAPLSVTILIEKENKCTSTRDGQLKAEVKGGKFPFQFRWNTDAVSGNMIPSLPPGNYTVSVTDAAGQMATASAVLISPPQVLASIELLLPASVNASNGQAQVKVTGGKSPYIFTWNNGDQTALVKNLSAGSYTATVTDVNGCTAVASLNVLENITPINAAISQQNQINCHSASTASLKVDVTGGKGPYQYQWSNGQLSSSIEGLAAGNYKVTITDVAGSTFTTSSTVTQPDPIIVSMIADAAASTNGSDGKATAKATGGISSFQYAWDNGEKINKATKLSSGMHKVTVTDASGCTALGEVEISENILALQVVIQQNSKIRCAGATEANIEAIVNGGKAPYTYQWNSEISSALLLNVGQGLYNLIVTDAIGHSATSVITVDAPLPLAVDLKVESPASTNGSDGRANATVTGGKGKYIYLWDNSEKTPRAEKLASGNHSVTVTDENGCTVEGNVMISENILPLTAKISQVNKIICAGQEEASLKVEVSGGKQPFTYSWSGVGKELTAEIINNLPAGTYTLKVTDVTGSSISNQFEITEPKPLKVTADDISPASTGNADGYLMLKATGGTTPYAYNGKVWPAGSTSFKVENLGPGDYQMKISDAAGCSADVSVRITEDILPLSLAIRQTKQILCTGAAEASMEASAKGGKPPYIYSWNNGPNSATLANVAEGLYIINVTDGSGQKSSAEFKVAGPVPMTVEITNLRSATNDRINDGKGTIQVKNGASPYTYSWSNGETTVQSVRLPIGNGQVVVTDQNGCSASAEFIVHEKVLPELTSARLTSGEPIRMEKIQFEADSVKLYPEAIPSLDELYEFLYDNPTVIIEVAGHTNGLPADDYCDRISSERAKSVADYLINKGIEVRRVISKGYGKHKPVASNLTPEGRKRNQRVEIRLIKIEE